MRNRLSIFSFDTLAGWPRPTRAFLLAIGLCAACRAGLYVARNQLDRIPSPVIQESFIKREAALVRGAKVKPKIVLMGDSLTIYGLCEDQLAAAAGLATGEVVNLGIESGRAWDALLLMRRNPEFFSDVRLALFNVGFHQVQQRSVNKRLAHFYRFSTLGEKLSADSLRDRALMLVDAVWPFHSERRELMGWLAEERLDAPGSAMTSLRPAWEPAHLRKLLAGKHVSQAAGAAVTGDSVARQSVSTLHWRLIRDLVNEWHRRGVKVVLITMPSSPKVIQPAESPSDPHLAFRDYLQSLVGEGVARVGWASGSEIGLTDEADYLDASHLTPCGAVKLTSKVIDELGRLGYLACVREPRRSVAQYTAAPTDRSILMPPVAEGKAPSIGAMR